jgi:hypothetical protein
MSSLSQQQKAAAETFVRVVIDALKTDKGVHAETAVAAMARMAGTFLFRSFAFPPSDITPGQAVLSDMANDQGPRAKAHPNPWRCAGASRTQPR